MCKKGNFMTIERQVFEVLKPKLDKWIQENPYQTDHEDLAEELDKGDLSTFLDITELSTCIYEYILEDIDG